MGKYVRRIVLLLLLATAVYLGIRFYPVWKAAAYLSENMDFAHYSFELEVELNQEEMQGKQGRVLEVLAGVTGFEPEAMCRLTVRGSVWEDTIHVLIYPEGMEEVHSTESPLIELYLGSDTNVVNETYIYNAVRNHLAEKFRLLGLVMPEQNEMLYITLEQVEAMFGLDLTEVRNFSLPSICDNISAGRYFILLAFMDREKAAEGSRYTLETEQAELEVTVPGSDSTDTAAAPVLRLHMEDVQSMEEVQTMEASYSIEGGRSTKETQSVEEKDSMQGVHSRKILDSIKEMTGMDGRVEQIFSQMGFPVSGGQLSVVKNLSVTIVPGGNEIIMPEDFVNQTVVELISRIRELVIKLGGG